MVTRGVGESLISLSHFIDKSCVMRDWKIRRAASISRTIRKTKKSTREVEKPPGGQRGKGLSCLCGWIVDKSSSFAQNMNKPDTWTTALLSHTFQTDEVGEDFIPSASPSCVSKKPPHPIFANYAGAVSRRSHQTVPQTVCCLLKLFVQNTSPTCFLYSQFCAWQRPLHSCVYCEVVVCQPAADQLLTQLPHCASGKPCTH